MPGFKFPISWLQDGGQMALKRVQSELVAL